MLLSKANENELFRKLRLQNHQEYLHRQFFKSFSLYFIPFIKSLNMRKD